MNKRQLIALIAAFCAVAVLTLLMEYLRDDLAFPATLFRIISKMVGLGYLFLMVTWIENDYAREIAKRLVSEDKTKPVRIKTGKYYGSALAAGLIMAVCDTAWKGGFSLPKFMMLFSAFSLVLIACFVGFDFLYRRSMNKKAGGK